MNNYVCPRYFFCTNPSVEGLLTSLGNALHLQMASGMNDLKKIYQVYILVLNNFPHLEYHIEHFFRKLAIVSHRY